MPPILDTLPDRPQDTPPVFRPPSAMHRIPDTHRPATERPPGMVSKLVLGGALIALAWVGATPGQQATPEAGTDALPAFGEFVDVRVINVEAVVTRKGERVNGLGADDFVLEVDGEEVPIEYFTEVRGGLPVGPGSDTAAGSARAGSSGQASAALPAFDAGRAVPTHYLIFVDDYFSIGSRRDRVLRDLEEQFAALGPEDRIAIVAYDGREIELLTSWTSSQRELSRALRRAQNRPTFGLQQRSEWRRRSSEQSLRSRQPRLGSSFSSIGFSGSARAAGGPYEAGRELGGRVSRVASAAASALRGFARPEGRRVMLLLSAGLPSFGAIDSVLDERALSGLVDQAEDLRQIIALMNPLVESANRLGYTVYPVDLGDTATGLVGAEVASLGRARYLRALDEQDERLRDDALIHLAEATGGEAMLDGARYRAFERTVADTRSYYWLGFSPTWQGDDGEHRLRLRLREDRCKGCKIRNRESFTDLSRRSLLSMQVESAHLFDLPIPSARRFEVEVGRPEASGWGRVQVPIELRVPVDTLLFLPDAEGLRATLELRVAATDDRGNNAEMPVIPVEILADSAPDAGSTVTWTTTLELRRRSHRLLLVLHDPAGETLLAHRLELEP